MLPGSACAQQATCSATGADMVMDAVFVYFLLQSEIARGVTAGFWVLMFNVSVAIKQ